MGRVVGLMAGGADNSLRPLLRLGSTDHPLEAGFVRASWAGFMQYLTLLV